MKREELKVRITELQQSGQWEGALELLRKLASAGDEPPSPATMWRAGDLAIACGRPAEARESFGDALEQFTASGQQNNALATCLRLLRVDEAQPDIRVRAAELATAQGLHRLARSSTLRVLAADLVSDPGRLVPVVVAFHQRFPGETGIWRECVDEATRTRGDEGVHALGRFASLLDEAGAADAARRLRSELGGEDPHPRRTNVALADDEDLTLLSSGMMTVTSSRGDQGYDDLPLVGMIEGLEPTHADAVTRSPLPTPLDADDRPPAGLLPDDDEVDADEEFEPLPLIGFEAEEPPPVRKPVRRRQVEQEDTVLPLLGLMGDGVDGSNSPDHEEPTDSAESVADLQATASLMGDDPLPLLTPLTGPGEGTAPASSSESEDDFPFDLPVLDRASEPSGAEPERETAYAPPHADPVVVGEARPAGADAGPGQVVTAGSTAEPPVLDGASDDLPRSHSWEEDLAAAVMGIDLGAIARELDAVVTREVEQSDPATHYDLGLAFKEMGLLEESIAQLAAAFRAGFNPLGCLEVLGEIFVGRGDDSFAGALLRAAAAAEAAEDAELVGVLYWLARTDESRGDSGAAARSLARVVAVDPTFRDASVRLHRLAPAGL